MAFRFRQTNCVVAGTFNIYVVQPSLLVELEIVPADARSTQIGFNLKQPALKFSADAIPGTTWVVTPEQLTVESERPEIDCGDLVARVLAAVRYTPLRGIGTNLVLTCDGDDIADFTSRMFHDPTAVPGCETVQRTIHTAVKRGDKIFNSQAVLTSGGIELSLNVHTELTGIATLPAVNEAAVVAARDFRGRLTEAVEIAETLYGIEIDYAANAYV